MMNSYQDVTRDPPRDPRDPRLYGRNNNELQFFPVPPPMFGAGSPPHKPTQRTSVSTHVVKPELKPPVTVRDRPIAIDPTTLAILHHNEPGLLHVDFYNMFKVFPTKSFSSEVHENCIATLKYVFGHFKNGERTTCGQLEDARRKIEELQTELAEKDEKIREWESAAAGAKKELEVEKENVSKMRIDTLRYKNEANKAKNELTPLTKEKDRLINAISEEIDRHKKTVAKYDALNVQYGSLFRENVAMKEDNIKFRKKEEQMEEDNVKLRKKEEQAEKGNDELRTKNEQAEKENAELRKKNEQTEEENAELRKKNEQAEEEIVELRRKNEQMEEEISELRRKNEQAEEENDELRKIRPMPQPPIPAFSSTPLRQTRSSAVNPRKIKPSQAKAETPEMPAPKRGRGRPPKNPPLST